MSLKIECADENGIMEMRLSENGTIWNDWIPISSLMNFTFNATLGTKTVYIQFKDNAGLISQIYSDEIILISPPSGGGGGGGGGGKGGDDSGDMTVPIVLGSIVAVGAIITVLMKKGIIKVSKLKRDS